MKVYFTDQQEHFSKHLEVLKTFEVIPYDRNQLTHKTDSIDLSCSFSDFNFSKLFNYHIFPTNILSAYPQWIQEQRKIRVGDTIVQQINIPPINKLAHRILVGVRVKEVIDHANFIGFAYETLKGHVEKGVSFFIVNQVNDSAYFKIETYSAPAQPLLKLLRPISSWYQDYSTTKALVNVRDCSVH